MTGSRTNWSVGILSVALFFAGCTSGSGEGPAASAASTDYQPPQLVGKIEASDIKESSGLSASECQDVLWTHNDQGNDALIYAMDLKGAHLGVWRVAGAQNIDWESIATIKDAGGKCSLLIADIGDNDEKRTEVLIYRIPEPTANVETSSSSAARPLHTANAEVLKFKYPDGSNNAETVLAHPTTGDIYIVSKKKKGPAGVYRVKPVFGAGSVAAAEKVADMSVPSKPEGLLTGGSMSPDGTRVMLCDVKGAYEYVLSPGSNFDSVWSQNPVAVDVGDRKQGEGVSYGRDGMTLYASSEGKNSPIYMIRRR